MFYCQELLSLPRKTYPVFFKSLIDIISPFVYVFKVRQTYRASLSRLIFVNNNSMFNIQLFHFVSKIFPFLIGRTTDRSLVSMMSNVETSVSVHQSPEPVVTKMCRDYIKDIWISVFRTVSTFLKKKCQSFVRGDKCSLKTPFLFGSEIFMPCSSSIETGFNGTEVISQHIDNESVGFMVSYIDTSVCPEKPQEICHLRCRWLNKLIGVYQFGSRRFWFSKHRENDLGAYFDIGFTSLSKIAHSGANLLSSKAKMFCTFFDAPFHVVFDDEVVISIREYSMH